MVSLHIISSDWYMVLKNDFIVDMLCWQRWQLLLAGSYVPKEVETCLYFSL